VCERERESVCESVRVTQLGAWTTAPSLCVWVWERVCVRVIERERERERERKRERERVFVCVVVCVRETESTVCGLWIRLAREVQPPACVCVWVGVCVGVGICVCVSQCVRVCVTLLGARTAAPSVYVCVCVCVIQAEIFMQKNLKVSLK